MSDTARVDYLASEQGTQSKGTGAVRDACISSLLTQASPCRPTSPSKNAPSNRKTASTASPLKSGSKLCSKRPSILTDTCDETSADQSEESLLHRRDSVSSVTSLRLMQSGVRSAGAGKHDDFVSPWYTCSPGFNGVKSETQHRHLPGNSPPAKYASDTQHLLSPCHRTIDFSSLEQASSASQEHCAAAEESLPVRHSSLKTGCDTGSDQNCKTQPAQPQWCESNKRCPPQVPPVRNMALASDAAEQHPLLFPASSRSNASAPFNTPPSAVSDKYDFARRCSSFADCESSLHQQQALASQQSELLMQQMQKLEQHMQQFEVERHTLKEDRKSFELCAQKLEEQRGQFEVDRRQLEEDHRTFLLQQIHSADQEMARREQELTERCTSEDGQHSIVRQQMEDVDSQRVWLEQERLRLAEERRVLDRERSELAHEQMRLIRAQGDSSAIQIPHAPEAHPNSTFGSWCFMIVVMSMAVHASLRHRETLQLSIQDSLTRLGRWYHEGSLARWCSKDCLLRLISENGVSRWCSETSRRLFALVRANPLASRLMLLPQLQMLRA